VNAPSYVDAAGVAHAQVAGDVRIVSLVPSITELLCDLGLAGQLVGRTGFCIHPRETVRTIPKVGGTKDVRIDRIRALAPTHVVVNIDENRRETAEEIATFVPSVVVTHPLGPLDNLGLYRLVGGIFGKVEEAERLCAAFESECGSLVSTPREPADVLYLIWRNPWMTISRDTYISRTLALVGWNTMPARADERYPVIDLASYAGRVERVLLPSEPYRFRDKHLPEVAALLPGATVALIDGEMTSWYGSRAIQGLRYLSSYTAAT
jgi:ABC-type Fe3+-hydroxamate transport system substrate-binding protein